MTIPANSLKLAGQSSQHQGHERILKCSFQILVRDLTRETNYHPVWVCQLKAAHEQVGQFFFLPFLTFFGNLISYSHSSLNSTSSPFHSNQIKFVFFVAEEK
ncbi:hypothetical protein ACTXT7_011273, partial [Hymenolepis weldensis]